MKDVEAEELKISRLISTVSSPISLDVVINSSTYTCVSLVAKDLRQGGLKKGSRDMLLPISAGG